MPRRDYYAGKLCECGVTRDAAGRCPTCDGALAKPWLRRTRDAVRGRERDRAAQARGQRATRDEVLEAACRVDPAQAAERALRSLRVISYATPYPGRRPPRRPGGA